MQFSDNGARFDVTLRGTITFTDDLTDVQSLSDGGSFTMRDWSHVVPRTVEIKSSGGKLTHAYYVGGVSPAVGRRGAASSWRRSCRCWCAARDLAPKPG